MPNVGLLTNSSSLPWLIGAVLLLAVGAAVLVAALTALFKLRLLSFVTRTLLGLLLVSLGLLEGTITIGIQGYRALTHEELAAKVSVRPSGPQRYTAAFRFPDGKQASYTLSGDEIYVDAHILKWHPLANILGLSTAYELDRVGGRYRDIAQERSAQRSVFSLAPERLVDLFGLRRRYAFLAPLVDAQYGSAAFVPVEGDAELEVRVMTGGLIIRQAPAAPK